MTIEGKRIWTGRWAAVATALLVLGAAGCAVGSDAPREFGEVPLLAETTVIVENTGLDAIAIYSSTRSTRLATVMPGRQRCVELPTTSHTQHLVARPVGGGKAITSPSFDLRPGDGWAWSIGVNAVASQLSLTPSRQCLEA